MDSHLENQRGRGLAGDKAKAANRDGSCSSLPTASLPMAATIPETGPVPLQRDLLQEETLFLKESRNKTVAFPPARQL